MRLQFSAAFLLALAAGLFLNGAAQAQTDTRGLTDRLDRLERDINTLQSQVYRSGGTTSYGNGSGANAPSSAGSGGGALSNDAYSMLDQRIGGLEGQIRDLNGQIEKVSYAVSQMQQKMEAQSKDNDFRFKELEQKTAGAPGAAQNGQTPPAAANGNANSNMGSPPGVLGQVSSADAKQPPAANGNAGKPVTLPGKTPQEKYDYAFSLLRNNDYDGATGAFNAFLQQHPQDPLAGNAVYWLGQIPFSQGDYDKAAPLFFNAYSKYPKSAKAGESLLKVGLSFSNLNKKKEACAAIARFQNEFPDASDSLRRQAAQEKQKLGC